MPAGELEAVIARAMDECLRSGSHEPDGCSQCAHWAADAVRLWMQHEVPEMAAAERVFRRRRHRS